MVDSAIRTVVQKYGGTSLATTDRVRRVAELVGETFKSGHRTVVVVSARGSTTDDLLRLAREVSPASPLREIDQLLSTGESASAALLAMALHGLGVPAVSLTGGQGGILVTGQYGYGAIDAVDTDRIVRALDDGMVVVVAGFQGIDTAGDVVTLGRGGSDTTAVALAVELRAGRCEIYTDVSGVYTADPRIVGNARVLPFVDPGVMAEMAFSGAKVLHSRAAELAAMNNLEIHIRNSFTRGLGTIVPGGSSEEMLENRGVIAAVTHDPDIARVIVRCRGRRTNLTADVLAVLANCSVPVDLVAHFGPHEEELRMGFTVRRGDVQKVRSALGAIAQMDIDVEVTEKVAKLSLVGMGLLNRPEYTTRMLSTLARAGISTSWVSATQLRASVTVPLDKVIDGVNVLHREFELERVGQDASSMASA